MKSGKSGGKLAERIKKAIADLELTHTEYQEILDQVYEDHHVDSQERQLLAHLQQLIENGTVKRVPG
jgi:hypothetical protein